MGFMAGRKGMSPIIATVLLIAFAVALGAMIMNWSSSLVAQNELDSLCNDVALTVRNPVCQQGGNIKVDVINSGKTEISSLVLKIATPEYEQNIEIKNSHLNAKDTLVRQVPLVRGDVELIELLAKVQTPEGDKACPKSLHALEQVPVCQ